MENPLIQRNDPAVVTNTIMAYSDPNLLSQYFAAQGWNLTEEIKETLFIARQCANLAAKLSAIKYLRTLVKEVMESSGMAAKVSKTFAGDDGSVTTFSARRIAAALNPEPPQKKTIESKEIEHEQKETDPDEHTGSVGTEGAGTSAGGRSGDTSLERCVSGGTIDELDGGTTDGEEYIAPAREGDTAHPCIQHRPPTCNPDLYPGISGSSS